MKTAVDAYIAEFNAGQKFDSDKLHPVGVVVDGYTGITDEEVYDFYTGMQKAIEAGNEIKMVHSDDDVMKGDDILLHHRSYAGTESNDAYDIVLARPKSEPAHLGEQI